VPRVGNFRADEPDLDCSLTSDSCCAEMNWLHGAVPVKMRGVAQPGRAPALGAGSRQFESGRPDH